MRFFVRRGPGSLRVSVARSAIIVAGVVVLEAVGLGAYFTIETIRLKEEARGYVVRPGPLERRTEYYAKPIRRPATEPARESRLGPDELVIGVVVDGKARAYSLRALSDRASHIVNDVVDETPVSVTYCDLTQCIRVFTDHHRGEPLDISVAGLFGSKMLVKVGDRLYYHHSSEPFEPRGAPVAFPFEDFPWKQTTWNAWKDEHPDTDVYLGATKRQATATDLRK